MAAGRRRWSRSAAAAEAGSRRAASAMGIGWPATPTGTSRWWCAADARPLSVPVDFGKAPPEYTEMGWYKLYGKLHYAKENDEIIPMIRIERIEATSEPTDGLLF